MRKVVFAVAAAALVLAGIRWWWVSGRRASLSNATDGRGKLSASSAARITASRSHRPDTTLQWPRSTFIGQGRKLAGVSTEERRRLNDSLLSQPAGALLDLWLREAHIKQDGLWLDFVANALSSQLRKEGTQAADVIARMAAFCRDPGEDDFLRWRMVETLGEVATPGALEAILDLAHFAEAHPDLQPIVLRQISRVGDIRWGGRFHEELSTLLEKSWNEDVAAGSLDQATSMALAKIGAPSSVELLLMDAIQGGKSVSEFEQSNDSKAWAAFEALDLIRNVRSIPVLSRALADGQPGEMKTLAAGEALSCMGRPEATRVLLDWIQGASQDVSGYVESWFSRMRDQISADLAAKVVADGSFANTSNQRALQKTLSDWRVHRY